MNGEYLVYKYSVNQKIKEEVDFGTNVLRIRFTKMYNNRDKIDADTVKKFFDRYGEVMRVVVYVNESVRYG